MNLLNVFAKLSLNSSEYEQGLSDASREAKSFGSSLQNSLAVAGKIATVAMTTLAAGVSAVTAGLVKAISSTVSYGDTVDKTSQKMGLSAASYQEWDAVMRHAGTTIDALQTGMRTLANAVESGNKSFARLGISVDDIASMTNEELFSATITALQNVENETERTYLAGQLLGRGATELGALLNMTAEETQAMKDRVHELGGVMSDEAVKAAASYKDSLQDMKTAGSGLIRSLGSTFVPSVKTIFDGLTEIIIGNSQNGIQLVESGIQSFSDKLVEITPKILDIGGKIVKSFFSAIISNLPTIIKGATQIVLSLIKGLIDNAPKIVSAALELIKTLASGIIDALPTLVPAIVDVVLEIVETLTSPETISMLFDAAVGIMIGLANGLVDAVPRIVEKIPIIIANLNSAISENAPKLLSAVMEIVVKLGTMLITEGPKLGKSLIEGLWEGIKGMASSLWDSIKSFFTGIWSGVKNLLGIHSPSTKFAEIGKNMALGVAEGWEDEFDDVKGQISGDMTFEGSAGSSIGRQGATQYVTEPASVGTYNIVLKIGERDFARAVWQANRKENQIVGLTLAPT